MSKKQYKASRLHLKDEEKLEYQWQPRKGECLFGFTVKVLSRPKGATYDRYRRFFDNLFACVEVICYCGEDDSRGILHYHGAIKVKKSFLLKKLRIKGYHLYLKPVYNFKDWSAYCFKNNIFYCWEYMQKRHRLMN